MQRLREFARDGRAPQPWSSRMHDEPTLRSFSILLLLALTIALTGCGKARDKARLDLAQMNINYTDSVFMDNAKGGNSDVVKLFLDAGMDIEVRTTGGQTALMIAALANKPDVVKLLAPRLRLVQIQIPKWRARWLASLYSYLEPIVPVAVMKISSTVVDGFVKAPNPLHGSRWILKVLPTKQGLMKYKNPTLTADLNHPFTTVKGISCIACERKDFIGVPSGRYCPCFRSTRSRFDWPEATRPGNEKIRSTSYCLLIV
jgi:hypothetical protein